MRVLALEPYFGGSHRAFLEGWSQGSRHSWTLLTLPPYHWKWRMRHAAVTFAGQAAEDGPWDLVFASDMVDLAQFLGLAPHGLRQLPAVAYFHENQLTYPVRREEPRDLHFAFTNFTTALAAAQVWFNSDFHQESFFRGLRELFERLPEAGFAAEIDRLRRRSRVFPQGIEPTGDPARAPRRPGSLRLLWAARWEFDKNPEELFAALELLEASGTAFRLSVLGESFREVPEAFARGRERFRHHIDHWGYLPEAADYRRALQEADVFVSTALHEFFGVSAAEALAAGTFALLPDRLAYPELLTGLPPELRARHLYDGTPQGLAGRLKELAGALAANPDDQPFGDPARLRAAVKTYLWPHLRPRLDDALETAALEKAVLEKALRQALESSEGEREERG